MSGTPSSKNTNKNKKKSAGKSHGFGRFPSHIKTVWKRGGTGERVLIGCGGLVCAIILLAVVIGLVKAVTWEVALRNARNHQEEMVREYNFNPGNIISDSQFFNGHAMNKQEIQAFLDQQGEACTGSECLKSKTFEVSPKAATAYCKELKLSGKQNAASIIAASSEACSISPKVLLTMLQKEQHLVSDTKPTDFQFKAAMGLSCPDDGHCDPKYAGFFNQVYGSAERYQYYVAHEEQYGYTAKDLTYVQYNPNKACGGSQVWIENKATALLYIYTPYQPNVAALKAGAGEGDSCSAYGNRNFALIYNGWFGDPRI